MSHADVLISVKTDEDGSKLPTYTDVPLLDMQAYYSEDPAVRARFIKQLGDAFLVLGFVRLKNYGIDPEIIENMYKACSKLFRDLPVEVRTQYYDPKLDGSRGYTPFGREHAKDAPVSDLKEFFHVGQELSDDSTSRWRGSPHYHPNIWPAEVPEYREVSLALYAAFIKTGAAILEALALYLELPKDFFSSRIHEGLHILRQLYYPPVPEGADPASIRAGAHEDINLITLLPTATDSGLQIQPPGTKSWVDVVNGPGELIVDSGDILHRFCPLFPSTTHRVINPDDSRKDRFSLPFFMHPNPDTRLDPKLLPQHLQNWITREGFPILPGITAVDFLTERLTEIGLRPGD